MLNNLIYVVAFITHTLIVTKVRLVFSFLDVLRTLYTLSRQPLKVLRSSTWSLLTSHLKLFTHILFTRRCRTKGFTLVEILIVAAIMGIIATISVAAFQNMHKASALRAGAGEVYGAFTDARGKTLASEDATVYGVYLTATSVTRFIGTTYVPGASTNTEYEFEGDVTATSSLVSTSVYFRRLTGEPSAQGTIYVRNSDSTSTITVHPSGLVESN